MNALFWNVRGITATGRKPLIVDTINKTHATILGFQETKKEDFSASYLKSLVGVRDFAWYHLPSKGSAGGILMGVDQDVIEVISWSHLDFSVSCFMKLKSNGQTFRVITVYGSPYDEGKEAFISERHTLFVDSVIPTLIGGDFNLVRNDREKKQWSD
jgi:exonuclease III